MLANRTARWSVGTALICVVLLVAGWFLLISPRRAEASDLREQAVSVDVQANLLQVKIARLRADFADLPAQRAKLKAIEAQLTPDADLPQFVRTLQILAGQSGVSLDSIAPGVPAVASAGPAAATTTVAGPGTLVSIPMVVTASGDYFEASLFLKYLQTTIKRSYLVQGLTVAPGEDVAATATSTSTSTSTAVPTATAIPTPTPTATATVSAADVNQLKNVSLTITGTIFVLLNGSSTLEDVKADAKAAGTALAGATPTPTTAP